MQFNEVWSGSDLSVIAIEETDSNDRNLGWYG